MKGGLQNWSVNHESRSERCRRNVRYACVLAFTAASLFVSVPAIAQTPGIQFIEPLPGAKSSNALSVSKDGRNVSGRSYPVNTTGQTYFLWSDATGRQDYPLPAPYTGGGFDMLSDTGDFASGTVSYLTGPTSTTTAIRVSRAGAWEAMPLPAGYKAATGTSISGDGRFVGGMLTPSVSSAYKGQAFLWSPSTGTRLLPHLDSSNNYQSVFGISHDGTVAVGYEVERAWKWSATGGLTELPGLSGIGVPGPAARAVSSDGQWVVGDTYASGGRITMVRWNSANQLQDLGLISGANSGVSLTVSDDGNLVAGYNNLSTGSVACLWTPATGMVRLDTYLQSLGVSIPAGANLYQINDVSGDGKTLVGFATFPGRIDRAFVVTIPSAPTSFVLVAILPVHSRRRRRR